MEEIQNEKRIEIGDPNYVKIILRTVGPCRPHHLIVPSHISVRDFRKLVAESEHLPLESLRLISRGKALNDRSNGEEVYIQLGDGVYALGKSSGRYVTVGENFTMQNSFIVAVAPKAPKHVRVGHNVEDEDDEDEDDLKFHLPESAGRWKRGLYGILHDKLNLPDIVLIAIFSLSLKTWAYIILWFMLAPVAHRLELGPLYILATGFVLIFKNLGRRRAGELSAYSIFNEDFRELPGTFNADRVDRDIRAGHL